MPDAVRQELDVALERYRDDFAAARWLDPATWHVTLVFLGSVRADVVPALRRACDDVAARWPPFPIDVMAGGGRVQRGDGVAWLWVRRNARGVIELAEELDLAVRRVAATLPEPRRAQSAHLTVARRAERPLLDALTGEGLGPLRAEWIVEGIALMRSHLGRQGARYDRVHMRPLTGPTQA